LPFVASFEDDFEHGIGPLQNVIVPKAQYTPAEAFQIIGTSSVPAIAVLATISFNDKFVFYAGEVRDEGSNRFLLFEFKTAQATVPQVIPEPALGVRSFAPQPPCVRVGSANGRHGYLIEEGKPSPNPLPHAGEGYSYFTWVSAKA
jgi:hypothetical protein